MNVETKSEIERMAIKATADFNLIMNAIFGADCIVRVEVNGALPSKVCQVIDGNPQAISRNNIAKIQVSESAKLIVADTNFLPF